MSNKAVCRTAPATLGLLNIVYTKHILSDDLAMTITTQTMSSSTVTPKPMNIPGRHIITIRSLTSSQTHDSIL